MEAELKASMAALRGALLDTCVRFLHQLLSKLIQLIVYPPVIAGQIGEFGGRTIMLYLLYVALIMSCHIDYFYIFYSFYITVCHKICQIVL